SPPEELTQSVPLDVTAAQHGDGRSSWFEFLFEQRRDRNRAARLDNELESVEQHSHYWNQRVVVNRDDVIQIPLMVRERHASHFNREQPVRESRGMLQRYRLSCGTRA